MLLAQNGELHALSGSLGGLADMETCREMAMRRKDRRGRTQCALSWLVNICVSQSR